MFFLVILDTRVFLTVAVDLVIHGIQEPVRFAIETKAKIFPMSERFWNFTKRPHYENFHINLKQVSFIPLFWKVVTKFPHNLDYFCPFNDYFLIDRGCHDRMVVGFTTICAISECHQRSCEFEYHSW